MTFQDLSWKIINYTPPILPLPFPILNYGYWENGQEWLTPLSWSYLLHSYRTLSNLYRQVVIVRFQPGRDAVQKQHDVSLLHERCVHLNSLHGPRNGFRFEAFQSSRLFFFCSRCCRKNWTSLFDWIQNVWKILKEWALCTSILYEGANISTGIQASTIPLRFTGLSNDLLRNLLSSLSEMSWLLHPMQIESIKTLICAWLQAMLFPSVFAVELSGK